MTAAEARRMTVDIERDIETRVEKIRPLLAGSHPFVPGAVLADLTARWICAHVMPADPRGQKRLRLEVLDAHIQAIRQLMDVFDLDGAD